MYGCAGRGEVAGLDLLHHATRVHDEDPVAEGRDQPQVVRHEDEAHAAPRDQFVQDREHLQLHRHVERGGRLVRDQQVGIGDQHHRDHRPLAHAARHFVREEPVHAIRVVDPHGLERGERAGARLARRYPRMRAQRLDDLLADAHDRIQRELRILQHHRDAPAPQLAALPRRAMQEIDAVEREASRGHAALRRREAEDGASRLRLAGPRFADDAETLAGERERHAAHGLGPAAVAIGERDAKVVDHQHRLTVRRRHDIHFDAFGSSASRRPSPSRLKARLTTKIAAPGAAATHH